MKLTDSVTLADIRKSSPCTSGWSTLIKNLGTSAPETKVTLLQILESNGVKDAYWALRCWPYKEYCLVLADVAESVLKYYTGSSEAPRKAITAIRDFHAGKIAWIELRKAAADADADAAYAAAYAAYAAYAAAYAADAYAAYAADAYTADAAAAAYAAAAYAAAAYRGQWQVNETILCNYLK